MLSYIISACRKRRFSGISLTIPDSHRGMSWEIFVLHLGTLACCCIQSVAPVLGFKVRIFSSRLLKSSNEQRERTGLEFSANETEGSIMTWQSDIRSILSWVNLHFVPFRTIRAGIISTGIVINMWWPWLLFLYINRSFGAEDAGSMFLRNVGTCIQIYTVLQPKASMFWSSNVLAVLKMTLK